MRKFRNSYLSLLMASVFLFVSCHQDLNNFTPENVENNYINKRKEQNLETTVKKHLKLTNELFKLYKSQNIEVFKSERPEFYKNKEELKNSLINNKFERIDEIVILSEQISSNIDNYILNNIELDKNQVIKLISLEIIKQNKIKKNLLNSKADRCKEALDEASANCDENYQISVGAVAVSTFWTFGVGTIIGFGVATGIMIKCHDDSAAAYKKCKDNLN